MTVTSSLRAALRPFVRRLRALLGAPAPKPQERAKPEPGKTPKPPARPAAKPARPGASRAAVRSQAARLRHFPPGAAPWSILFLGGSNTVMKRGYVDALIATLADRRGPPARVTNLAVGAASSVHGLMVARRTADLAAHDVVVIEYGVNDGKLSAPERLDIWRGATEGLLRFLLSTRPDVHVVFVLFLGRDVSRPRSFEPADATLELVAHYAASQRVSVVDIDHLYRDVLFPDRTEFVELYSDRNHYARPQVAGLTGALIAGQILAAPQRPPRDLPPPLHPWHFAGAKLLDLVPDPAQADRVFANSRYKVPTRRLAVGESLTLDLPGPMAAFEYVSTRASATLRITEEAEPPRALHTRNVTVGMPKSPAFLIRCEEMSAKPWATLAPGPRRVTFQALAEADPQELRKSAYQIPAEPGAADGVYLTRILCAG